MTRILAFTICALSSCAMQVPDKKATRAAMDAGIDWLVRHQDEDGGWSASLFVRHDPKTDPCTGVGKPDQEVFVTAWATMALLWREGTGLPHAEPIQKALRWLKKQMQADGFFGASEPLDDVAGHALVCVVMFEAKLAFLEGKLAFDEPAPQQSMELLVSLRLSDGTWPARIGGTKGDVMTTCCASLACLLCRVVPGINIDLLPAATAMEKGALATPSLPSAEAMLRWMGENPPRVDARDVELMRTLANHLPRWGGGPDAARMDYFDWYLGTYATSMRGGDLPRQWYQALQRALVVHQRTDGAHAGSWDPVDASSKAAGRVYATAVNVCSLSFGQHSGQFVESDGAGVK